MIQIRESGMIFEFDEDNVYLIENSKLHKGLNGGVKSVEFIVALKENEFFFIEAKSSSPRYKEDDQEPFNKFISDISAKFVLKIEKDTCSFGKLNGD